MQNSPSFELLSVSLQQSQQNLQQMQGHQSAPTSSSSSASLNNITNNNTISSNNVNNTNSMYNNLNNCKTLANNKFLPKLLYIILHNPRGSILGLLVVYIITLLCWIPGYAFTYMIPEIGVYISIIICILSIGKFIVISLTFPGGASSCQRIIQEIEKEFMKYTLKVLENSTNIIKEDGIILLRIIQQQQQQLQMMKNNNDSYNDRNSSISNSNLDDMRNKM